MDASDGSLNLCFAQVLWIVNQLLGTKLNMPGFLRRNYYQTLYGNFFITPDLISTFAVSPSFERDEINVLFEMIDESKKRKEKILFVDIGAFFGLYSVAVGNRYKKYKNLDIITFEPGTEYLSVPTLPLLEKNIATNNLKNLTLHKVGIGSANEVTKNGMKVRTLDTLINRAMYKRYDVVYIKLDIDDYVVDGIIGIQKSVEKFKRTVLLIEDFVKPKKVFPLLKKHNYNFLLKNTPYNSFWEYKV
jgi:hypothetical protein